MKFIIILFMIFSFYIVNAATVQVVGFNHTMALKADGTLLVWGENEYGQLGLGDDSDRFVPTRLENFSDINMTAAGYSHSITLKNDGTLLAWGDNSYGQLGLGDNNNRNIPTVIPNVSDIKAIAVGWNHSIALKTDGTLLVWGYNSDHQLGLGSTTTDYNVPTPISGVTGIIAIGTNANSSFAIKTDGSLLAWGYNGYGQLGLGDYTSRDTPTVVPNATNMKSVLGGEGHTIALRNDGTLLVWGGNSYGQLGLGDSTVRLDPTPLNGLSDLSAIASGKNYTIALKNDGTLLTWGINYSGQLGLGDNTDRDVPTAVTNLNDVTSIGAGEVHSLAVKNDGSLVVWGDNSYGQLGLGDNQNRNIPVLVNNFRRGEPISNYTKIAVGKNHTLALKNDGNLSSWGDNYYGELGLGTDGNNVDHHGAVDIIGVTGITDITAGYNFSIALKNDGTIRTWGHNNQGQLGLGDSVNRNTPTEVSGENNITAIAAGWEFSIAIKDDNSTLIAWGDNSQGQLGLGDTTDRNVPTPITGVDNISKIALGRYHAIALKDDGTLLSWGDNSNGQLGLGDNTDRNLPTVIAGVNNVVAIATGMYHSIALKNDGTLLVWGDNSTGQLGLGDTTDRNTPTIGASSIAMISCGSQHTVALKIDGTILSWGYNYSGQLGLENTVDYHVPAGIADFDNVALVGANGDYSYALKNDHTLWMWGSNWDGQLGVRDATVKYDYPEVVREFKALNLLNLPPVESSNTGTSLLEGATDIITNTKLDYDDDYSPDTEITYTITTNVLHGAVKLSGNTLDVNDTFTQDDINNSSITYVHDGSNTLSDSFIFKVTDGDGSEVIDKIFNITIIAVDDNAPTLIRNVELNLDEGASAVITEAAYLSATDTEADDATLLFTVTVAPIHGQLENSDNPVVSISTFTQQNLLDSKISYVHDDSDTIVDSFTFNVSDGINTLASQIFNISINPIDDLDTDGDGIIDTIDTDDDNDGMPDDYEVLYSFNPLDASDAIEDADLDGYTNLQEYNAGSNPRDAQDKPLYFLPAIIMYLLN